MKIDISESDFGDDWGLDHGRWINMIGMEITKNKARCSRVSVQLEALMLKVINMEEELDKFRYAERMKGREEE